MATKQPPPPAPELGTHLRQHIAKLTAMRSEHDELHRLRHNLEKRKLELELAALYTQTQPSRRARYPMDYYANQIRQWHDNLPRDARCAPRSMSEFMSFLHGRTPGLQPHVPEVAAALRQLGWSCKRCWQGDGGRRFWWPQLTEGS